mgnify:CR=1 FL=1
MKKRTKTISSVLLCGALMMNTGISAFAAGTGNSNVTLQVETGDEPAIVSVKVPTEIPLKMDKEGAVTVPQDLEITNLSDMTDVDLTGLSVVGKNGWSIEDYAVDLASRPEGTKELSMSFRGDGTTDTGEVLLTPDAWTVAKDSALPLNIAAKLPKQGNDYVQKGDIAQVNYRFTVTDDAGGEEETPDESVISNNWSKDKVLKDSVTPVTFNYDSTDPDTFIQSVESSDPSVTVARGAETYSLGNPGSEVWNVTAAAKGSASVTATLNTGETTQFDVNVYELNLGGDGSNTVTVPEVPDKGAGDSLETGDITIDIPITGPDGDDTITVTPDIPDDTVLEEGENTIDVTTDIDGVTVHITIIINIKSENPSNGLVQSVQDAQAMGFTFSSYEDGLQIDSFENKQFKSEINVPEQIGDFRVLKIKTKAFDNNSNVKSISIPDCVELIEIGALDGLGITELTLPVSFTQNEELDTTLLFKNCPETLKKITVPDGTTRLATSIFKGCTSVEQIILPESLVELGNHCFYGCTSLSQMQLPNNLEKIGQNAFRNTAIKELYVPDSVTTIKSYSFSGLNDCTISIGKVVENDQSTYYGVFQDSAVDIIIRDGVQKIGVGVFCTESNYFGKIKSVTIPSSVTEIGKQAFAYSGLTSLTIPDSVTSIGNRAFEGVSHIYYNGTASGSPWGAASIN